MMHLYGEHFTYMDNGEIKGITLPYDGDNVVMKVFMPTADDGDNVAEEAAGQRAHEEGADAAQQQQSGDPARTVAVGTLDFLPSVGG